VARLRQIDARAELAFTVRDYADVLAASPYASDRARAAAMTTEADALAAQLGIGSIVDRPRRILRRPDRSDRHPRAEKGRRRTGRATGRPVVRTADEELTER